MDDTVWKEVLDRFFEDFIRFFFPSIHADIDWTRGPEFRDKELQEVAPHGAFGRRYVDKLASVDLRGEGDAWVLLHVEVQGRARDGFAERMYLYNHRIFERYGKDVTSLALLTHAGRRFRARPYERGRWGCELRFAFPVVKIADFRGREEALEKEENPFALLVLAHLRRMDSSRDPARGLEEKTHLVRILYGRGYQKDDIIAVFRFLDWLFRLPSEREEEFVEWHHAFEKERSMPYVTSVERIGEKRGLKEGLRRGLRRGREEGLRESIELCLENRFGDAAGPLLARVREVVGVESLRRLLDSVLAAPELEAVARLLDELSARR